MKPEKPLLIIMLGLPGSGKTYFSSHIAAKLPAVWLNSDGVRAAMFEKPREVTDVNLRYKAVFGAMDHVSERILATGMSVVYDANSHTKAERDHGRKIAEQCGAQAVVVHIVTPDAVSDQRAQTRTASDNQVQLGPESLAKHRARIELPLADEMVIKIDGTIDFEEQFRSFETQLQQIFHS